MPAVERLCQAIYTISTFPTGLRVTGNHSIDYIHFCMFDICVFLIASWVDITLANNNRIKVDYRMIAQCPYF